MKLNKLAVLAMITALIGPAHAGLGLEGLITKSRVLYEQETGQAKTGRQLNALNQRLATGEASITLYAGPKSRKDPLSIDPNQIGTGIRFDTLQSAEVGDQRFDLRLSLGNKDKTDSAKAADGTELAWRFEHADLYVSSQPRHWGPGWVGSLILDQSSPAYWTVGVRRPVAVESDSKWLSWVGPWAADFFVGQLQEHTDPADPYLIGIRVLLVPIDSLEIGLSRAIQWGGEGRPQNWTSFKNALIGNDNVTDGGINRENEPGNQLAGVDLRYAVPLENRQTVAVYGQLIGEDETDHLPSKFMRQLGAEYADNQGAIPWRMFFEVSETKAGKLVGAGYRNSIYQQGFTNRSQSLAHPMGGDARLYSLGVVASRANSAVVAVVHTGDTLQGSQFYTANGSVSGAQLGVMIRNKNVDSGVNLSYFKAPGVKEEHAQVFVRWNM